MQPVPKTSQALSEPLAINGNPSGMPVASAAAAVISPSTDPAGDTFGNISGRIGIARHFQSFSSAHC